MRDQRPSARRPMPLCAHDEEFRGASADGCSGRRPYSGGRRAPRGLGSGPSMSSSSAWWPPWMRETRSPDPSLADQGSPKDGGRSLAIHLQQPPGNQLLPARGVPSRPTSPRTYQMPISPGLIASLPAPLAGPPRCHHAELARSSLAFRHLHEQATHAHTTLRCTRCLCYCLKDCGVNLLGSLTCWINLFCPVRK